MKELAIEMKKHQLKCKRTSHRTIVKCFTIIFNDKEERGGEEGERGRDKATIFDSVLLPACVASLESRRVACVGFDRIAGSSTRQGVMLKSARAERAVMDVS
jgi:hypothetical protein